MSNTQLSLHFFLQLGIILLACRIVGLLAKRIGQPQVVGEMITGVLLGPSLFGLLAPSWQQTIFPKPTMGILYAVSQLGLVLYMFLVGVEFDINLIRKRLGSAVLVSSAGILVPLGCGALLAFSLFKQPGLFMPRMSVLEGVLFLGIAISITAFPMLARIIVERGLSGTSLGTLALAAGSLDDATAWCLLALLLAFFKHDGLIALTAIAGGITYAIFILFIAKPLLTRLDRIVEHDGDLKGSLLAFVLALVMISAYITDLLGIYAVFGSFLIGIAMPRKAFAYHIKKVLEPVATNLLLPLFFVYSGLNTHIGLVNTPLLWGIALIILIVSCFGKGIACWAAARLSGEPNREALVIGTLMNARGLIELILLNIGLDQGLITPTLFTILVLMAIVTTLIASPIFELVYRRLPMTVVLQEL